MRFSGNDCDGCRDSMRHYFLECNVLWPAMSRVFPPFELYVTPLALLGLSPVSEAQMFDVVLAFHTYHAMRKGCNMYGHPIDNVARSMRYYVPRSSRLVRAFYATLKRSGQPLPSMATLSAPVTGLNNNFCSSFSRSSGCGNGQERKRVSFVEAPEVQFDLGHAPHGPVM